MPLSHFSRTAMHCCRNFFHCMCFCMYKFVIFESIRFRLLGIFVVSGAWRRWLKSLKWSFLPPFSTRLLSFEDLVLFLAES
jgi:hypothetical protein